MTDSKFCIVLTTVNDEAIKRKIIKDLLSKRLAACIQIMPIESHYLWEGNVCEDNEELLVIKTKTVLYKSVEDVIRMLHSYDTPQIVQLPITSGFPQYLNWLENNTIEKLDGF